MTSALKKCFPYKHGRTCSTHFWSLALTLQCGFLEWTAPLRRHTHRILQQTQMSIQTIRSWKFRGHTLTLHGTHHLGLKSCFQSRILWLLLGGCCAILQSLPHWCLISTLKQSPQQKVCLVEDHCKRFFIYEADSNCVEVIVPSLLTVFAKQLLNNYSGISGSYAVCKAPERYLACSTGKTAIWRRTMWHVQGDLLPMQSFQEQMAQLISKLSFYPAIIEQTAHRRWNLWTKHW